MNDVKIITYGVFLRVKTVKILELKHGGVPIKCMMAEPAEFDDYIIIQFKRGWGDLKGSFVIKIDRIYKISINSVNWSKE